MLIVYLFLEKELSYWTPWSIFFLLKLKFRLFDIWYRSQPANLRLYDKTYGVNCTPLRQSVHFLCGEHPVYNYVFTHEFWIQKQKYFFLYLFKTCIIFIKIYILTSYALTSHTGHVCWKWRSLTLFTWQVLGNVCKQAVYTFLCGSMFFTRDGARI